MGCAREEPPVVSVEPCSIDQVSISVCIFVKQLPANKE